MYVENPLGPSGRRYRPNANYAGIVQLDPPPLNLCAQPGWRMLVELAARHWAIDASLIVSPSRDALVVAARHHAMWLMRTHTRLSFPAIGRLLKRDHSSVVYGMQCHIERMAGRKPSPFVWTEGSIARLKHLVRDLPLGEACRKMGLKEGDYLRVPERRSIALEAYRQADYRRIATHLGAFGP